MAERHDSECESFVLERNHGGFAGDIWAERNSSLGATLPHVRACENSQERLTLDG